jgi:pyruvate, orthophosphate dikinase
MRLERHYKDLQDFEFTIQEGKLYMLQTRVGKRTAKAAVRIAVDMAEEGLITRKAAILRVEPEQLNQLLHPVLDESTASKVIARGLPASPGAAVGRVVFSADDAAARGKTEPVVLVRAETVPDDIHGMEVAVGILTERGGMTSHAAVVTRGMGKPCIAGCSQAEVNDKKKILQVGKHRIKEGDWISLDGSTGRVIFGKAKLVEPDPASGEFATFMKWTDEFRKLGVRANADIPRDAAVARRFGAEGIGLCRTEHMFFAGNRILHMQRMIMACRDTQDPRTAAKLEKERRAALTKLLPMQRADFVGLFKAMDGLPVIIRTLDPPLHEFLPKRERLLVDIATLQAHNTRSKKLSRLKKILAVVEELHEFNPMLGLRGCRLGIIYPEITEMQARAIFEAACGCKKRGDQRQARGYDSPGCGNERAGASKADCHARRKRGLSEAGH